MTAEGGTAISEATAEQVWQILTDVSNGNCHNHLILSAIIDRLIAEQPVDILSRQLLQKMAKCPCHACSNGFKDLEGSAQHLQIDASVLVTSILAKCVASFFGSSQL